jgi:hypothetical protein
MGRQVVRDRWRGSHSDCPARRKWGPRGSCDKASGDAAERAGEQEMVVVVSDERPAVVHLQVRRGAARAARAAAHGSTRRTVAARATSTEAAAARTAAEV